MQIHPAQQINQRRKV